jgi:uncharacterized membrane protein
MTDHVCGCPTSDATPHINVAEPERYASAIAGGFLLALGLNSSNTWQRVGSLIAGSGLIYRGVSGQCMLYRMLGSVRKQREERSEAQIDEAIEESFPASDPPSFNASVASRSFE